MGTSHPSMHASNILAIISLNAAHIPHLQYPWNQPTHCIPPVPRFPTFTTRFNRRRFIRGLVCRTRTVNDAKLRTKSTWLLRLDFCTIRFPTIIFLSPHELLSVLFTSLPFLGLRSASFAYESLLFSSNIPLFLGILTDRRKNGQMDG